MPLNARQRQTIELRLTLFTALIFSHHQPKMGLAGFVIALLLTTLLTFGATATAEELAFKPSGDLQRIKYTGSGQDNVPVIKVLLNGHVNSTLCARNICDSLFGD